MIKQIYFAFKAYKSNHPVEDKTAQEVAERALAHLSSYFGKSIDAEVDYMLRYAEINSCFYGKLSRRYYITLEGSCQNYDQYCAVISHEMYHRLTLKKTGLHRAAWIDEMLANLASKWYMEDVNLSDYAQFVVEQNLNPTGELSTQYAKNISNRQLLEWRHTEPDKVRLFYKFATQKGLELEKILTRVGECAPIQRIAENSLHRLGVP